LEHAHDFDVERQRDTLCSDERVSLGQGREPVLLSARQRKRMTKQQPRYTDNEQEPGAALLSLDTSEREHILYSLAANNGNRALTAELLGIAPGVLAL
jgi:transcriptional regulator with GAF, ATPase, and Fis domain